MEAATNSFAKYPKVDICFEDLSYKVFNGKKGSKTVLQSNNGTFSSGNLTGILGSSGAGKTTLLNILAGYVKVGVSGRIYINNRLREIEPFKKISTYIMQEDLLQSFITVREYLMYAINLKMNPGLSLTQKNIIIERVTDTLGLSNCMGTRAEHLSGGQRKRVSIAIELVNNPQVIFLDEPTTGLDNVTMKQCIQLLKSLAKQGKTVVCTIHQPSDSAFALFDHVYFMDNGYCIYNDTVEKLVPFLSYSGFSCPTTHNPADYIIELTQLHKDNVKILGKQAKSSFYSQGSLEDDSNDDNIYQSLRHRISFWRQLSVLMHRSFLQLFRNRISLFLLIFHHVVSGLVIGGTFLGAGKNASMVFENFKFGMTVIIYVVYSNALVPSLTYPLEVKLVGREYFNGWFSLKAYFFCTVVIPLFTNIVAINLFMIIAYIMTDQPMEIDRYIYFCIPVILLAINSNTYGLAIGALFNSKNGAAVTPATLAPLVILSIYGMGFGRYIHPVMRILQQTTFFRYGIVAVCSTMFENRNDFECPEAEVYCHYKDTELFLQDMGMNSTYYPTQIIALIIFAMLHIIAGYTFLRIRFSSSMKERMKNLKNIFL